MKTEKRSVTLVGGAMDSKTVLIPADATTIGIPHRGVRNYQEFIYDQDADNASVFRYVRTTRLS